MKVFLNTRLLDARRPVISSMDRGFLFGDGLYETVRAYGGTFFEWSLHERRLRAGARVLGIRCPWSSLALRTAAHRVLKANRMGDGLVRLTLTRGAFPIGLASAGASAPTLLVTVRSPQPLGHHSGGIRVAVVGIRRVPAGSIPPFVKSLNMLDLILARREARREGADEALLLNMNGCLTEGTVSNVFFVSDGVLHTPSLVCGLLPGITRALVLRLAKSDGIRVRQGVYRPSALRRASEIFMTGTGIEISAASSVEDVSGARRVPHLWKAKFVGRGPVTARVQALLERYRLGKM